MTVALRRFVGRDTDAGPMLATVAKEQNAMYCRLNVMASSDKDQHKDTVDVFAVNSTANPMVVVAVLPVVDRYDGVDVEHDEDQSLNVFDVWWAPRTMGN
jgi:hypothetical protein